ncbi:MAG: M20/M25/M40 family metallo-hydrolase [Longimicrobiales bacterium]
MTGPTVRRLGASLAAALATLAAAEPIAAQTRTCPADAAACEEIRRIAATPAVQDALRAVEGFDDRTIADLIELTEIPAPPFTEEARGRRYAELLREAGADSVWTDEVGNVLALRRGAGGDATLAVTGHLDTVFPEGTDVTVEQRGDTLFAPGVADDTRGLVAVLGVLRALEAANIETRDDLLFVGTVGEEGLGDLRGVKHLFREGGPRIDAFISIDGGGDEGVTHQALGSRRYRVTFKGPGGHSWGAFGTANPIHALGRAIALFDDAAATYTADGPRTSYNVGRIGGGTSINSVPFEAWMEVDMRSESQSRLAGIDSLFKETVQRALGEENAALRRNEPLTVDVELVGDRPSGETPKDELIVRSAIGATRYLGLEPSLGRSSTDSNIPISRGIPAVTIGGGGESSGSHSLDEWWRRADGSRGIQRALLIVLGTAGLDGDGDGDEL